MGWVGSEVQENVTTARSSFIAKRQQQTGKHRGGKAPNRRKGEKGPVGSRQNGREFDGHFS